MNQMELFKDENKEIELHENIISQQILNKMNCSKIDEILNDLFRIKEDTVFIDYVYFKYLSCQNTYFIITQYLTNILDNILIHYPFFNVHINMKALTFQEINNHHKYICSLSVLLKNKYPTKLSKCLIFNSPAVFSKIYNIISLFIEKETQMKIQIMK
jgi:hypothetical protein